MILGKEEERRGRKGRYEELEVTSIVQTIISEYRDA
jgi:hypothetical protein